MTMTPEQVMKKCQIGTNSQNMANSLHAECYGTIGRLLHQQEQLRTYVANDLAGHVRQLNAQYEALYNLTLHLMMRYERREKRIAEEIITQHVAIRITLEEPLEPYYGERI